MSIQSEIDRLSGIKADLKSALAEKGQTVGEVFSTYPAAVRAIESGGKKYTSTDLEEINDFLAEFYEQNSEYSFAVLEVLTASDPQELVISHAFLKGTESDLNGVLDQTNSGAFNEYLGFGPVSVHLSIPSGLMVALFNDNFGDIYRVLFGTVETDTFGLSIRLTAFL